YDTVAGCILHELERIPLTGDRMKWNGFSFEIVDMDGHRIDKILVAVDEEILDEMED
ncbi:MAG TPA: transporter associated domain-containing protein, partial [Chitinophagaceae bacterium]|nr:transporter associated domain-containing protein [Chitinophagaceae bacterium]